MTSEKISLRVEGMTCNHCTGMVQKTLEEIDGISNVSVDLDGKKASFETNNSQLVDKAIKEVTEAGYKASNG